MGCSTSRSNDENDEEEVASSKDEFVFMTPALEQLLKSKDPEDLLKAFIHLDKAIMSEESRNPSSTFGQAMSRQQLLKAHLQAASEIKNQNEILSGESPTYELFNDLGLENNPAGAAEHEEFLASVNRRAINENSMEILQRMLDSVDEEIRTSSRRISQLQSAYHQQDELLGQVFGETYGSQREKLLEKELDTMRYFRDMLSIGVLQWELCADNTRTAANLLRRGVSSWKAVKDRSLKEKIGSATEARNCFQEALLLIQTSQELLQDVQFSFCTVRELKGVSQTMDYVFTDMLTEERYSHASEVYEKFLQRAISLEEWVREVLSAQLQKDLLDIEENVSRAALKLRNERVYLICRKLRIRPPSEDVLQPYNPAYVNPPPILDHYEGKSHSKGSSVFDFPGKLPANLESKLGEEFNIQNYFQRIVENRKNTMWPSRRIDELQTLMVQQ